MKYYIPSLKDCEDYCKYLRGLNLSVEFGPEIWTSEPMEVLKISKYYTTVLDDGDGSIMTWSRLPDWQARVRLVVEFNPDNPDDQDYLQHLQEIIAARNTTLCFPLFSDDVVPFEIIDNHRILTPCTEFKYSMEELVDKNIISGDVPIYFKNGYLCI
jgi:hypothetical protein